MGLAAARRSARLRTLGLALLAAVIVAGAAGVLGVRTRSASATAPDGTRLTVTYAAVSRPGLATPWDLTIERPGGFDAPIEVRTSSAYFAAFDENGLDPDPASATTDADETIWTFEPPGSDTLVVSFDARLEPGVQWRRAGATTVVTGSERVTVRYTTWVLP